MAADLVTAIELPDGRRLAYTAAGPRDGFPVVYLHGAIGAPRWSSPELEVILAEQAIRYVLAYRPGFAGSDRCRRRRVADFAPDLECLADRLGYDRLSLVGVSSGAPFALACAAALADRVAATAVVSPLSPPCGEGSSPSARYRVPALAFGSPGLGPALGRASLTVLRLRRSTSSGAMVEDYSVSRRPWGFDTAGVPAGVRLWHGTRDRLVPVGHALRLAAALPGCEVSLVPGAGHFFYRSRVADVLAALVAERERPSLALAA